LGDELSDLKNQLDDILSVSGDGSIPDSTRIRLEVLNQVRDVERRGNDQID
jgi:hypothetical protein